MQFVYPHTDAEVAANAWEEIPHERAMSLLGCVPPAKWVQHAFAVGEPLCHMDDGRVIHTVVVEVGGKHYAKPYPLASFDDVLMQCEIRRQLADEGHARHWYCEGGAGFILYRGRKVVWETVNFAKMKEYMDAHNLKDVERHQTNILFVR